MYTDRHAYIDVPHSSQVGSTDPGKEKEDVDGESKADMPVYDAPESSSDHY